MLVNLLLQNSLLCHQFIHLLRILIHLGQTELQVDILIGLQNVHNLLHPLLHDFFDGFAPVEEGILIQQSHGITRRENQLPVEGVVLPGNDP